MATNIIMPALEMAQETGRLVSWLKREGEAVAKGEPIMEVETDKVTVEIEAPESGILGGILAKENDVVQVGKTIGWILAPGEAPPPAPAAQLPTGRTTSTLASLPSTQPAAAQENHSVMAISPLARKMAEAKGIDVEGLRSNGKRIGKADVLAYIEAQQTRAVPASSGASAATRLAPASPKARRLASERGIDLGTVQGSGPEGAVLAADVPLAQKSTSPAVQVEAPSTVWRLMAERMSASWTTVPHFYLVREVDAGNLIEWRGRAGLSVEKKTGIQLTYTDLLVKVTAFALHRHPRLNASWAEGGIRWNQDVHIGIATAVDEGLIVPVIHHADLASLGEIALQRSDLVERARQGKLRPADISGGTFTLTNLGMYGVDAFDAIVNTPQAAILSVGRIADRVVARDGQVQIRPTLILTLSLDHRVVDGARAAQFLDELATLAEDPWGLLT